MLHQFRKMSPSTHFCTITAVKQVWNHLWFCHSWNRAVLLEVAAGRAIYMSQLSKLHPGVSAGEDFAFFQSWCCVELPLLSTKHESFSLINPDNKITYWKPCRIRNNYWGTVGMRESAAFVEYPLETLKCLFHNHCTIWVAKKQRLRRAWTAKLAWQVRETTFLCLLV